VYTNQQNPQGQNPNGWQPQYNNDAYYNSQQFSNNGGQYYNYGTVPPMGYPPKKKNKIIPVILTIFIVIIVAFAAIGFYSSLSNHQYLENFEKCVENYEPGTQTDNTYSADFWDIDFTLNAPWEPMESAEMESITSSARNSAKSSMIDAAKKDNVSSEDLSKMLDIFYCETEFGYSYSTNEGYANLYASVVSIGEDTITDKEYIDELVAELENDSSISNISTASREINSKTYETITLTYTEQGVSIEETVLVRQKDGMFIMICSAYTDELKNMVFDTFDEIL